MYIQQCFTLPRFQRLECMPLGSCIALTPLALDAIQIFKTADTGMSARRRLIKLLGS